MQQQAMRSVVCNSYLVPKGVEQSKIFRLAGFIKRKSSSSGSVRVSSSICNSFSDFFQVVKDYPLLDDQNELPTVQICPGAVQVPLDTDTADEVLSQTLYAGFGKISSTLDGLFSVIFPKQVPMEQVTEARPGQFVTAEDFGGSLEKFHMWLKERLPDGGAQLSLWGTAPGTKRVGNLWHELLEGEILLEDSMPPKRTVHVASVQIQNEAGEYLVEAYQEMADGRIRHRNRPLSEKMRPGESVEEACLRGISEELGCQMGARERVILLHETYRKEEEERESFSYPGLLTRYVIHSIVAHVKQLPETDFDTEEDEPCNDPVLVGAVLPGSSSSLAGAVGVRKHFWKWVQAP